MTGESREEARGYGFPPIPWEYVTHCLLPYGQRDIAMVWGMVKESTSPSHSYTYGIYLAPPLLRVPIGQLWVEVFLLQAWNGIK